MADFEFDPVPALTKQEHEALRQFLVDSEVVSAADTVGQRQTQHTSSRLERVDEDWKASAACRNIAKEMFYDVGYIDDPDKEELRQRICGSCVVRLACTQYALQHNDKYGVWGGFDLTKKQGRKEAKVFVGNARVRRPKKSA